MRGAFKTLLVLTNLAIAFAHGFSDDSNAQLPRRKSLGFGVSLPNKSFTTNPLHSAHSLRSSSLSSDPLDVARSFLDTLLGDLTHTAYVIRDDSYTDKRTGVTHVYVNQVVNGLQVTDGRINVNIKDGKVLSYGDSFYKGPAPTFDSVEDQSTSLQPHAQFCTTLSDKLSSHTQDFHLKSQQLQEQQQPLGVHPSLQRHYSEIQLLKDIHSTDCSFLTRDLSSAHPTNILRPDPSAAALMFMMAATPSTSLADDLHTRFQDYLSSVMAIPSQHLQSNVPEWEIAHVPDAVSPVKAKMAYAQAPSADGNDITLKLVWQLEVEMKDNWYSASVDAFNPSNIISVVDWASDSSVLPTRPPPSSPPPTTNQTTSSTYHVFKWGINDPSTGNRTIEKENFDTLASPLGWHSLPVGKLPPGFKSSRPPRRRPRPDPDDDDDEDKDGELHMSGSTYGNNVYAHENWEGRNSWVDNYRPTANDDSQYHFKYDPESSARVDPMAVAKEHINATITQLFYTSNMVHDLYYRYGFDEVSGNFQQHNFGRGGREGDAVIANAQDGSGFNNANFMTPPDGQNGRCRMYLWNTAKPYRDGDFEAGIVIHELSHGLSTRLTGGPANSNCLGWGEAGGMGEGWGDFLATSIRSTRNYSDYPMGAWAANDGKGIRYFVYSLDTTVNPSTYKILNGGGYWGVHAIGEVWAEILWVVQYKLIEKHGYSETLYPPKPDANGIVPDDGVFYRPRAAEDDASGALVPIHGNTLLIQLVLDGMKLQPCDPGFVDARDAIIQADENLTGGENYCALWEGFAERGLGRNAEIIGKLPWGGGVHKEDYTVPVRCRTAKE